MVSELARTRHAECRTAWGKLERVSKAWEFVIEAEGVNFSNALNRRFCKLYVKRQDEMHAAYNRLQDALCNQ